MKKRLLDKYNLQTIIFFGILCFEVIMLCYYNLITTYSMDHDSAKVMYHTIKILENKTFVIPNWVYMTTGEWDCTSFLAMPLYLFTKNIFLSFSIANIINIFLFGIIIYVLMSSLNIKKEYIFMALCIIYIPYKWGMLDYTNMLFYSAGQYVYKVLATLSLLALFHYNKQSKVGYYLLLIFTMLLLVLTITSSSLYVVMCGVFPILASRMLYLLAYNKKPSKDNIYKFVITCVCVIVSYVIHHFSGIATRGDGVVFGTLNDFINMFNNNILSLLDVMKLLPSTEGTYILKPEGIIYLFKIVIFVVICIYGLGNLRRFFALDKFLGFKKDNENDLELIKIELISIFLFNWIICLVTSTAARYQLIGFTALVILSMIELSQKKANKYFIYLFAISILIVNVLNINLSIDYIKNNKSTNYLDKEICLGIIEDAKDNDLKDIVVYDTSGTSEVIRIYDMDVDVHTYNVAKGILEDYDVVDVSAQTDKIMQNCLFVVRENYEFNDLPDVIKENYKKIDKVNCYYIYAPSNK